EATDRDEARPVLRDELDDGRPPLRIARCRDCPCRLVEQYVSECLSLERPAVQLDAVALRHERVELPRLTVDCDPPGLDPLRGLPARGDPGPGEVGVQTHA